MSNLVEYLRELNIDNNINLKKYIKKNDIVVLETFLDNARKLVWQDWKRTEYTPFSFVPSAELSGAGGCIEISCKLKRANIFKIFCTLL